MTLIVTALASFLAGAIAAALYLLPEPVRDGRGE